MLLTNTASGALLFALKLWAGFEAIPAEYVAAGLSTQWVVLTSFAAVVWGWAAFAIGYVFPLFGKAFAKGNFKEQK